MRQLARAGLPASLGQRDAALEIAVGNLQLAHRVARAGEGQRALARAPRSAPGSRGRPRPAPPARRAARRRRRLRARPRRRRPAAPTSPARARTMRGGRTGRACARRASMTSQACAHIQSVGSGAARHGRRSIARAEAGRARPIGARPRGRSGKRPASECCGCRSARQSPARPRYRAWPGARRARASRPPARTPAPSSGTARTTAPRSRPRSAARPCRRGGRSSLAVSSIGWPASSGFLQLPQTAPSARRARGTRLVVSQSGQTTWRGSLTDGVPFREHCGRPSSFQAYEQ